MITRTVCLYGTAGQTPEYVRNRLLIRALETAGYRVVRCTSVIWAGTGEKLAAARDSRFSGALRFLYTQFKLFFRYLVRIPGHDAVLVAAPGHLDVPFARIASWLRRKPLVFDAFYSLYDTVVDDRKLVAPGTLKARSIAFLDRLSCRLADRILVDTTSNRDYFCEKYGLDPEQFTVIPAGAPEGFEDSVDEIATMSEGTCTVLFQGSYVPLQGADIVIQAAALLKHRTGIHFRMIGSGQTRTEVESIARAEGLSNVEFIDWMDLGELKKETLKADICLGIFGRSGKAGRVIPHKVYAALAMGKPVITADTEAAREWLEDRGTALLCIPGDPGALAGCIQDLTSDADLRRRISEAGLLLYKSMFHSDSITIQVNDVLCTVSRSKTDAGSI